MPVADVNWYLFLRQASWLLARLPVRLTPFRLSPFKLSPVRRRVAVGMWAGMQVRRTAEDARAVRMGAVRAGGAVRRTVGGGAPVAHRRPVHDRRHCRLCVLPRPGPGEPSDGAAEKDDAQNPAKRRCADSGVLEPGGEDYEPDNRPDVLVGRPRGQEGADQHRGHAPYDDRGGDAKLDRAEC